MLHLLPAEPFQVPVIGLTLPIMWFYLLMNVVTQYPSKSEREMRRRDGNGVGVANSVSLPRV